MTSKNKVNISVVVPAYNEAESVGLLYHKLKPVLDKLKIGYEVVFIDDGSTDSTLQVLKEVRKKDKKVKILSFRRNFGQTAALSAGFDHAVGDIVIAMDSDLQNDPRDIPELLKKMNEGYDVVSGWRKDRKDPYLSKVLPSLVANKFVSVVSGVRLHDSGCTLKAYRSAVLREVSLYGEMHRFIPAILHASGASIAEISVRHSPRKYGKTKYGASRTTRVLLDLILVKFLLSFQTKPLQFFGQIGGLFLVFGGSLLTWLFYARLFLAQPLSDRPLFLLSVFVVMVGIQFITLGLLAEMMMRTYFESQGKKTYVFKEKLI